MAPMLLVPKFAYRNSLVISDTAQRLQALFNQLFWISIEYHKTPCRLFAELNNLSDVVSYSSTSLYMPIIFPSS